MICFQEEEGENKEEEEDDPLDETALDWWSRYYASLDTLDEVKVSSHLRGSFTKSES